MYIYILYIIDINTLKTEVYPLYIYIYGYTYIYIYICVCVSSVLTTYWDAHPSSRFYFPSRWIQIAWTARGYGLKIPGGRLWKLPVSLCLDHSQIDKKINKRMLRYVCVMGPISDPTEFQWHAQLCTSRHTFTYKHHQVPSQLRFWLRKSTTNVQPKVRKCYSDHFLLSVYSFSSDLCYIYASLLVVASPVQEARRRGGWKISIDKGNPTGCQP